MRAKIGVLKGLDLTEIDKEGSHVFRVIKGKPARNIYMRVSLGSSGIDEFRARAIMTPEVQINLSVSNAWIRFCCIWDLDD